MKINDIIQVRYIGEDDPAKLRHGKVYEARVLKKNWYGIVDEMQDGEYAYPPRKSLKLYRCFLYLKMLIGK